jgi:uncharacterized protein (TIGR02687 family)
MAELNLKQIINRLNAEFTGETRKLVFWYDERAEFVDDIQSVELDNAKVYLLEENNQFKTKYFLEKEDTKTNYLIYAPFSKPDVKDNHLEDTLLYSKRFYADRASLLAVDLGIEEKYKHVIEKYIKFFANKERTQRFYDLEIENFNEKNIVIGLLSAICKTKTCSFEEVVRITLTDSELEDNKFLEEFAKYDLADKFWRLCEEQFGYIDPNPSLEKLVVTMFVTYTDKYIKADIPKSWSTFVAPKPGNVIAFMDNLMNNVLYKEKYDELSKIVARGLHLENIISEYQPDSLVHCDTFEYIDEYIQKWIVSRLMAEDTGAKVDDMDIMQLCDFRTKMHFGKENKYIYSMLESAYNIVCIANYEPAKEFKAVLDDYVKEGYKVDYYYRKFYYYFDKIEETEDYEKLKALVENIYTNEYLDEVIPAWNQELIKQESLTIYPLQRKFYDKYIGAAKEKTVVIISDAMRYEVGREFFVRMQDNPKCTARIENMLSTLPSYTRLGMAALLPHKTLEMTDDFNVLVDGKSCDNLASRQKVLQDYLADSVCVQFDDVKSLKKDELRKIFTGKQAVYVYHNQIDARGDKPNTEDEVFIACEEAIKEIMDFINRLASNANTYKFIVTSDHGFIYKRDKITESDKIGGMAGKNAFINRRFVVSNEHIIEDGVGNVNLGFVLGNNDQKIVSYPISSNVFKVSGGGQNFVHGGSSPQEMIVPIVDIKMEKGHMDTTNVKIALVSMVQKITNLITTMDFIQSEPVSDTIRKTTYKIFFEAEGGERISNENTYVADNREPDSQKRIFRMRFNFKNQKYDRAKNYYLVVSDANTDIELFRHEVVMDIAFADDFGW